MNDLEKCESFLQSMKHIRTHCLEQMTIKDGCHKCFYWRNKGPEEMHDCIFWRAGLGHPDKW